jgi:hypothetical protein
MTRMKTSRAAPAAVAPASPAAPAALAPWNWAAKFARQQFAVGAESGLLLARGFEAMRGIQQQAREHSEQRHADAARKLGSSPRPADALAVQSELLRGDMEEAARCWQELVKQAMEVVNELAASATQLANTEDVFAAVSLFHWPKTLEPAPVSGTAKAAGLRAG